MMDFIQEADPGIFPTPIEMPWGKVIILTRQGQPTPWKVYLRNDGTSRLLRTKTKTLGPVDASFTPAEYPQLVHAITENIRAGYI